MAARVNDRYGDTVRAWLLNGVRAVAGGAAVILLIIAIQRSTSDVTVRFAAEDTEGLRGDVVMTCKETTSLYDSGGVVVPADDDSDIFHDRLLEDQADQGRDLSTESAEAAACSEARDSRLITLVWLVAGALTSLLILLTVSRSPPGWLAGADDRYRQSGSSTGYERSSSARP